MLTNDRYTYHVIWSDEDEEYVGLCAEFISLSWLADTPEEALSGIRRVIAEVVADLQANGEAVPDALKPSLDDFMQAQRYLRVAA